MLPKPTKERWSRIGLLECCKNEEKPTDTGHEKSQMDGRYNVHRHFQPRL